MKSYDEMSTDAELIEDYLANRDDSAAALLYHRYKDRVFTYIRGKIYNHEDAEELTQETFSKAFQSLGTLVEHDKVLRWLYGIATKTVHQWIRDSNRQKRQPRDIASVEEIVAEGIHPDSLITQRGPAELLERKTLRQQLRAAIAKLPEKQRTVFEARQHDTPYEDIAREMDTTLENARVMYTRALARLRTELLKNPDFEEYA